MRRGSHGGTVGDIHSRVIILSCALLLAILSSPGASALSLDSIIDTTLSIAKLDEPTPSGGDRRETNRSESAAAASPAASANAASNANMSPSSNIPTVPTSAVVATPLDELSPLDISTIPVQAPYSYHPATAELTASHAVVGAATGDWAVPLQATKHGWKLFGVAWYWWLIVLATGYSLIRRTVWVSSRQGLDNTIVS